MLYENIIFSFYHYFARNIAGISFRKFHICNLSDNDDNLNDSRVLVIGKNKNKNQQKRLCIDMNRFY